ncbi:MAG: hypothetical protein ABR543_12015 [Gemmatimonadaceae bacterium]
MNIHSFPSVLRCCAPVLAAIIVSAPPIAAQWVTVSEQFYYPGRFNWQFRHNYSVADRLFNGFDYGHAILYETLWSKPGAPVSELEEKEYNFITRELLVHPPKVPLEELAIEVAYAQLAPEAKMMFEWAHLFHRQVYDVWADERMPPAEKDAKISELLRYYKSRPDLAFSSNPKSMELMEGQYYALAFRQKYPKFNGLIWAYHWLQVGLYEPLVTGKTLDERQTGVTAAVARFKQMLHNPPDSMPRIMPMTAAVAPEFARRYPEAAIIFDNLHAMHDVISDILASDKVPRAKKRQEILLAGRRYRDNTSFVMTQDEWLDMAKMMGVENMGGPSVNFLPAFPTPTVARGAVMAGMDHSKMAGMQDTSAAMRDSMPGMAHDKMQMQQPADSSAMHEMGDSSSSVMHRQMMQMHMRMMADPVIRSHMMADTAMHRMMMQLMDEMPAEHRAQMEKMMKETEDDAARAPRKKAQDAKRPAQRQPAKPAAKPEDPHAGHQMTPAKPPPKKPPFAKKDSMPGMDHSKMPGMRKP